MKTLGKTIWILGLTITFLVLLSQAVIGHFTTIGERIEFQSSDGSFAFTTIPSKGRDLQMMERQFEKHKSENGLGEEVVVYRVSEKDYTQVKRWLAYLLTPEWQHPHISTMDKSE